jgi:hypothetical protein
MDLLSNYAIGVSQIEEQDYKKEISLIKDMRDSIDSVKSVKLDDYKKFADEIQKKWNQRNKEYNARLILEICKPLSSGRFKDNRQYDIAREYALSALKDPNDLSIKTELDLMGCVATLTVFSDSPKGEEFAKRRKKDVEIRLHGWKRLIDAIDPKWDPNDKPFTNVLPPIGTTISAGGSPEDIKDPKLRAEYEVAIEKNRQKSENYLLQSDLQKWQKEYLFVAEQYIIKSYSTPPFNLDELKQYLEKYKIDKQSRDKILNTVQKNINAQNKAKSTDPNK